MYILTSDVHKHIHYLKLLQQQSLGSAKGPNYINLGAGFQTSLQNAHIPQIKIHLYHIGVYFVVTNQPFL